MKFDEKQNFKRVRSVESLREHFKQNFENVLLMLSEWSREETDDGLVRSEIEETFQLLTVGRLLLVMLLSSL